MKIKEFCEAYKEHLEIEESFKTLDVCDIQIRGGRFYFTLVANRTGYGIMSKGDSLINLDNEDLEYLYNKYSKKLKEEMEFNIANIKNEYKDLI